MRTKTESVLRWVSDIKKKILGKLTLNTRNNISKEFFSALHFYSGVLSFFLDLSYSPDLIIWNSLKPGTCWHFPQSLSLCIQLTIRATQDTSVTLRPPLCGTMKKSAQTGTEHAQEKVMSRLRSAQRPRTQMCSSPLWTVQHGTSYERKSLRALEK